MQWNAQQEAALQDLGAWARQRSTDPSDQIKYLAGFAGVGKTTLLRHLAADVPGMVQFAAYTGKSAYVMRAKGCAGATTIHSLIYKPAGDSKTDDLLEVERKLAALPSMFDRTGEGEGEPTEAEKRERRRLVALRDAMLVKGGRKPMFSLNPDSDLRTAHLLIIDECSMVDARIGQDLLSFGKKILVSGDPAQLPPVGGGGFFTERRPDHMLTEVHRQAKESGILWLSTDVREGRGMRCGSYGDDCLVTSRHGLGEQLAERVLAVDQVLVGRNATRHSWNARYRELTNRKDVLPVAGDKVVCLRNNHEAGLLNGSLWRVHEAQGNTDSMDVEMTVSSEEDGAQGVQVVSHAHHFMGREDDLKKMSWNRRDKEEFDFGYVLTTHKSQGSQWDDVLLLDESGVFRADSQRWLYTGITRAAKNLTVIT